jgi:hypothetical protein
MEYKVISIIPVKKGTVLDLAKEFEMLINKYSSEGWEYIRIETLKSWVPAIPGGCFGSQGTPGYYTEDYFIVIKK